MYLTHPHFSVLSSFFYAFIVSHIRNRFLCCRHNSLRRKMWQISLQFRIMKEDFVGMASGKSKYSFDFPPDTYLRTKTVIWYVSFSDRKGSAWRQIHTYWWNNHFGMYFRPDNSNLRSPDAHQIEEIGNRCVFGHERTKKGLLRTE